jgi:DNA replication protein DnaC
VTKKAFKDSQIPPKYAWKFIRDFEHVDNDRAMKVFDEISKMKRHHDKSWTQSYYLWGLPGTGKTLLGCIMLQELMLKYGERGKYIDLSRQFFQRLKDSFNVGDKSYGEAGQILDELIRVPFLVIDDFGVQRNTEWELEMLYNLIDSRYAAERPVIITSNNSIKSYSDIAEGRIYSRVVEMCKIVRFDFEDWRVSHADPLNDI